MSRSRRSQQGMTLFIALIILVMVTLLAVSAFRASNGNLKIVGSMQGRQEGVAAAQAVVDQVISSNFFTLQPATVAAQHWGIDINGDGNEDYVVALNPQPKCVRVTPVRISATVSLADVNCAGSARVTSARISSYCADTVWEINANTTDSVTGAQTSLRQGVAVRVAITDANTACK